MPEVEGVFTQAERLADVESMVQDAVSLMCDVEAESVEVEIKLEDQGLQDLVAEALDLKSRLEATRSAAVAAQRLAATRAVASGLPQRDIAALLGISHQRVNQVVRSNNSDAGQIAEQRA